MRSSLFMCFSTNIPYVEDVQYELLSSVMEYAGLVDATALLYIWPTEIAIKYRLCIISGPDENPMFSTFSSSSQSANPFGVQDIIMRCQHSHFTLLKPLGDDGVGGGSMVGISILNMDNICVFASISFLMQL